MALYATVVAETRRLLSKSERTASRVFNDSEAPDLEQIYTPVRNDNNPGDANSDIEDEKVENLKRSDEISSKFRTTKWPIRILIVILRLLLVGLALTGTWDLLFGYRKAPRYQGEPLPCYCGESVAEARSLGCEYVAMSSSWLPPKCRNEEIEANFDSLGPNTDGSWSYYADENLTQLLTPTQVALMGDNPHARYYTTWEWHVVHCLFYWRKVHLTQIRDFILEPNFNKDSHILHCARLILGTREGSTKSGISLGNDKDATTDTRASMVHWEDLHMFRDGW